MKMSSLFSPFSGQSMLNLPLNWVIVFSIISLLPLFYFTSTISISMVFSKSIKYLYQELYASAHPSNPSFYTAYLIVAFMLVMLTNLISLVPYVFTATAHLVFSLSLALPLWLGCQISLWEYDLSKTLASFVPGGTPTSLISFMVMIEIISNFIRPATLAIRLAANMTAGHLLLTLIAQKSSFPTISVLAVMLIGLLLLSTLEISVSLIQAYVLTMLSNLYALEATNSLTQDRDYDFGMHSYPTMLERTVVHGLMN